MHSVKDPDQINAAALLSGKKCLVVEDNEVNQALVALLLQNAGMLPDLAGDGYQAVERLKASPDYDIILMDLQMPVMDGYTAAVRIRQELHLDIPILAMTASTLKEDRDRCAAAGMQDCISKPFDFTDFRRRVARLVRKPYDLGQLESLNDKGALLEIVDLFLTRTPAVVKEMIAEAGRQDWEKVYRYAHQMKSSTGVIGAQELVELLRQIEDQARYQKDMDAMSRLLQCFCPVFERVETLLRKEREKIKEDIL